MDPQIKGSSDGEDIPSDFFDDFTKDEFIEGLSVVDEWDNEEPEKSRGDAISFESAQGSRESENDCEKPRQNMSIDGDRRRSSSEARMDDFIKPGSRRDPNKTNEAIKRDKEMKVKQHIAKHLESIEDLRPPGTELDDYYDQSKNSKKKEFNLEEPKDEGREGRELSGESHQGSKSSIKDQKRHYSPIRHRSPHRFHEEPVEKRYNYDRPGKYFESTGRYRQEAGRFRGRPMRHRGFARNVSPHRYERRTYTHHKSPPYHRQPPPRYEQHRRSRSPNYYSGYRKERRYNSPRGSPPRKSMRSRSSRSPRRNYEKSRSRSPRRSYERYSQSRNEYASYPYKGATQPAYPVPLMSIPAGPVDLPMPVPNAQYAVPQPHPVYNPMYSYANQPTPPPPQPVPAPVVAPGNPGLPPSLPSPHRSLTTLKTDPHVSSSAPHTMQPADALAKLVADGILSHEDYLKLAPNKGAIQQLELNSKMNVLNRCNSAVAKLDELMPANRLIISNFKKSEKPKSIAFEFSSPLKKTPVAEFSFTNVSASANALKNKQVIDTIVSTLDLYDIIGRPKKNLNIMRDVAVQTMTSHCDKCVIREAISGKDVGTSIDQDHFSSTTHTQVVEADLQSSKSIFNASGSTSDSSAPISFAHMTPAQLVSQLVARAKTLKQPDSPAPNQPRHHYDQGRNPYDDRRGPQNYRNNYNNYRY